MAWGRDVERPDLLSLLFLPHPDPHSQRKESFVRREAGIGGLRPVSLVLTTPIPHAHAGQRRDRAPAAGSLL